MGLAIRGGLNKMTARVEGSLKWFSIGLTFLMDDVGLFELSQVEEIASTCEGSVVGIAAAVCGPRPSN